MKFKFKPNYRKFYSKLLKFTILFILVSIITSCIEDTLKNNNFPNANTTLRRNDSSSLHVFVLSDWGFSGSSNQRKVANEMSLTSKLVGLNFILTCGDNFQLAGVDSVNDPLWKINYEDVYNDSSLLVPWYPALGNHDCMGNPDAQVEYSKTSKYWKMPARYYSFVEKVDSKDSVRFIVLDTQGLIQEYQSLTDKNDYETIAQYRWLKEILSAAKEKWIIVTGHHPVFSASIYHGDTNEMKEIIKPLFDQYKVDFYICGHDHDFEHAREMGEYTDYIVTGTGGDPRYIGSNKRTIYSLSTLGFTYLSISGNYVKLNFITADGKIGYRYTKNKE